MKTNLDFAELRKRIGWSQSQMARAIGVSHPTTISQWESGRVLPAGTTMRFLKLLNSLSDNELMRTAKRLEELDFEPRVKK